VAARVQMERETAAATLQQRNSELEQNLRHVEQLAATDPMTGCYNRRAFARVFEQLFADAYRTSAHLSCIMVDLDNFKQVNDVLGHAIGDELIRLAARSILSNLRQMDVACRYGGDEFIVLLPKADALKAAGVADRIRRSYTDASAQLLGGGGRTTGIGISSLQESDPRPASAGARMIAANLAQVRHRASAPHWLSGRRSWRRWCGGRRSPPRSAPAREHAARRGGR